MPIVLALGTDSYAEWGKQNLIERTNAFRAEFRIPPYREHPTLMKTAQIKAEKLVRLGIVGHVMPSGENSFDLSKIQSYVAGASSPSPAATDAAKKATPAA